MLRKLLLGLAITLFVSLDAQSPNDIINIKTPNQDYLAHLIKSKIDSVRNITNLQKLANDSLLYVVSKSHCEYLSANNKTSHTQLNTTMQTPEQRLAHYGAIEYLSFELIHSVYIHRPVTIKPDPNQKLKIKTTFKQYDHVANYFVTQWIKNNKTNNHLINKKYNVIGIHVSINQLNDNVKVVALLGKPYFKYLFEENKKMFPYSNYTPQNPIKEFNSTNSKKIISLPYNLKETTKEKCIKCEELLSNIKFDLTQSGTKMYLETSNITNLDDFSKFLSAPKNGFILETLEYEDYHPGNPTYYDKPTRRNQSYTFNGEIQAPVYGPSLIKDLNVTSNTFRSLIGNTPKITTLYEHNLYIIYKGMVCGMYRFPSKQGDPLALYQKLSLAYSSPEVSTYTPKGNMTELDFALKGENFSFSDSIFNTSIDNHNKKYKNQEFTQATLIIEYPVSDLLGGKTIKTDEHIAQILAKIKKQAPELQVDVIKLANVQGLQSYFKSLNDKVKANYSEQEFIDFFSNKGMAKIHSRALKSCWKAKFTYSTFNDKIKTLKQDYLPLLQKINRKETLTTIEIDKAYSIQSLLLTATIEDSIILEPELCIIPEQKTEYFKLIGNQIAYNYNTIKTHKRDTLTYFYKKLKAIYESPKNSTIDKLNFLKFSCNHMTIKPYDPLYRSNTLKHSFNTLKPKMTPSELSKMENAFEIKLTLYYSHYLKAAAKFESSINNLVQKYADGDKETKLRLVYTLGYYGKTAKLNEIIKPYIEPSSKDTEMLISYNKMNQSYISFFGEINTEYYQKLIRSYEIIGKNKWCNQFIGKGNISFQTFDYLPLYHKYCAECQPYRQFSELKSH